MAQDILKPKELSREQILDLADAQGRKLGTLLALSPLADDIKVGVLSILEYATPAQIDALSTALEEGYLHAENKVMNDFLAAELRRIKNDSDREQKDLETAVLKDIETIEKKING
ncbi:MAG: hypothetical protein Q8R26_02565 [bacterium]|nr:hypothetical protein [bacterium]